MTTKAFKMTNYGDGSTCFIPIYFDPRAEFGKVRAPIEVTINGHSHCNTTASLRRAAAVQAIANAASKKAK